MRSTVQTGPVRQNKDKRRRQKKRNGGTLVEFVELLCQLLRKYNHMFIDCYPAGAQGQTRTVEQLDRDGTGTDCEEKVVVEVLLRCTI